MVKHFGTSCFCHAGRLSLVTNNYGLTIFGALGYDTEHQLILQCCKSSISDFGTEYIELQMVGS